MLTKYSPHSLQEKMKEQLAKEAEENKQRYVIMYLIFLYSGCNFNRKIKA